MKKDDVLVPILFAAESESAASQYIASSTEQITDVLGVGFKLDPRYAIYPKEKMKIVKQTDVSSWDKTVYPVMYETLNKAYRVLGKEIPTIICSNDLSLLNDLLQRDFKKVVDINKSISSFLKMTIEMDVVVAATKRVMDSNVFAEGLKGKVSSFSNFPEKDKEFLNDWIYNSLVSKVYLQEDGVKFRQVLDNLPVALENILVVSACRLISDFISDKGVFPWAMNSDCSKIIRLSDGRTILLIDTTDTVSLLALKMARNE